MANATLAYDDTVLSKPPPPASDDDGRKPPPTLVPDRALPWEPNEVPFEYRAGLYLSTLAGCTVVPTVESVGVMSPCGFPLALAVPFSIRGANDHTVAVVLVGDDHDGEWLDRELRPCGGVDRPFSDVSFLSPSCIDADTDGDASSADVRRARMIVGTAFLRDAVAQVAYAGPQRAFEVLESAGTAAVGYGVLCRGVADGLFDYTACGPTWDDGIVSLSADWRARLT